MFELILLVILNNNVKDTLEVGVMSLDRCHEIGSQYARENEVSRISYDCFEVSKWYSTNYGLGIISF